MWFNFDLSSSYCTQQALLFKIKMRIIIITISKVQINKYSLKFILIDKIKAGAKAVGKKMGDPDRDTGEEYETEKGKERVVD